MIVNLLLDQTRTVDQMRAFVEGADLAEITHFDRDGAYALISQALERVLYPTLGKADKGVVSCVSSRRRGFSRAHIDRLVRQHRRTGHIRDHRKKPPARPFTRRYTPADIALLAEVDEAYGQLSPAPPRRRSSGANESPQGLLEEGESSIRISFPITPQPSQSYLATDVLEKAEKGF